MKTKFKQSGFTLVEQTVVIAGIVLLAVLAMPAKQALMNSFRSRAGVRSLISSAMASARAIAAKEQRYAGIRFQIRGYHEDEDSLLKAGQYIVFIIHDPADSTGTGLANGFRAVRGIEPIEIPNLIGVMDLRIRTKLSESDSADMPIGAFGNDILSNNNIDNIGELMDTMTFSIIFSPDGKLVIHNVRVRNKNGFFRPINLSGSADDIFNSPINIRQFNTGMFIQDDYANLGLGEEPSRNNFIIFDRAKFRKTDATLRYTEYLWELQENERIYINPYTGRMIR